VQLLAQRSEYSPIVVPLFRQGQEQSFAELHCVADPRESRQIARNFADHITLFVPPRGGSRRMIYDRSRKSTKVFVLSSRHAKQEGFDWDESESRCETEGAAIAVFTGGGQAVGVADRQTARATDSNRGASASHTDPGSHTGGGKHR